MTDTTLEYRLKTLGLKQEFKRELDFQGCLALSFVIMSPCVGVVGGLSYAWLVGGPGPAVWGWKLVSLTTLCTGLSMAEILSGLPCSGGPYYWAGFLGGRHSALLSWITGWSNLMGLTCLLASSALTTMANVVAMVQILAGVELSLLHQLWILQGILVVSGCVNSASPAMLTRCMFYGAFINFAGVIAVVLLLPTISPWRQSPKFVFATFFDRSMGPFNVPSNGYLWFQGTCLALFNMAGFDSCSHLSEEIKGANSSAPLAMLWAILAIALLGYALLLAMLFCVQDSDNLMNPVAAGPGYAAGQLVYDVFGARFGSGAWSATVLGIFFLAGFMCTIACVTSTSRMMFSFARSRALPFSSFFSQLSRRHHMPVRAVWLAVLFPCAMSALLLVPDSLFLNQIIAFGYAGQQLAHGLPIFCRLTFARHSFEPGPFCLGRYSSILGWISVACTPVSMAMLSLPSTLPLTATQWQFPLTVAIGGSVAAWYLPRVGARHWYIDPKGQAAAAKPALAH